MIVEFFVLRVLENEKTILLEQFASQDQLDDLLTALQIVGCVGENHIKLFATALQVEEYVCVCGVEVGESEFLGGLTDEGVVYGVDLHTCHALRASRAKLIADRSGARKEVQHIYLLEIHKITEYVEEVFLRKVRCGTCSQVAGRNDGPAAIFATDDSHLSGILFLLLLCHFYATEIVFDQFVVAIAIGATEGELRLTKVVILVEQGKQVDELLFACEW